MSFARRALPHTRRIFTTGPRAQKSFASKRSWNQITKRSYASEGHGSHAQGSDTPWAIGAIVVTAPSAWYLWSTGPSRDEGHGHGHGHEEHDEGEHGEEHEEQEESNDEGEKASDETNNEGKDEEKAKLKDDSNDDSKGGDSNSEELKGDDAGDEDKSDSSDSEKSDKETPDTSDDEDSTKEDAQDSAKDDQKNSPEKGKDEPQHGATGAMHRARSHDDVSLSKKSEGIHDTAKIQGPVDPNRRSK